MNGRTIAQQSCSRRLHFAFLEPGLDGQTHRYSGSRRVELISREQTF